MRTPSITIVFTAVLVLSLGYPAYAQDHSPSTSDTLKVWQNFFALTGFKYSFGEQNGDVGFGASNVKRIINKNALALHEVETFGKFQVVTFISAIVSAGVLGWGTGSDNDDLVYVGLGGLVISIVFDQIGYSHLKKGARIYNDGLK